MIPKIIHYCWFGGKNLPLLAKKRIASREKYLPNYKIKEWNQSNFDINCCDYVREAYQAKSEYFFKISYLEDTQLLSTVIKKARMIRYINYLFLYCKKSVTESDKKFNIINITII